MVASHLRVPVEELKERITFTEFLEWLEFIRWEEARVTKLDYYLAQIACETRRSYAKHPGKVKMKEFLIEMATEDQRSKMAKSKKAWLAWAGIKGQN